MNPKWPGLEESLRASLVTSLLGQILLKLFQEVITFLKNLQDKDCLLILALVQLLKYEGSSSEV